MLRSTDLKGFSAWTVFLLIGILLSACTVTTTGSRIPLSQANLAKIRKLGILVKQEGELSVRLQREKLTAGLAQISPLAAVVEAGVRGSRDRKLEQEFKPIVGPYDPRELLDEKLRHHMTLAQVFNTVVSTQVEDRNVLKAQGFDGVLAVNLREWGLRLCPGSGPEEQVQVGLNANSRMFLLEDGRPVWEHDALYLYGTCRSLEDFRSQHGVLKAVLSEAIENLSVKIVNEIRFP